MTDDQGAALDLLADLADEYCVKVCLSQAILNLNNQ
ncbi:MAG: hypothetical protein CM1200mP18_22940 [Gammaproteobacteria bacterium]|nr:MAG: hypothetical protein CM1200mP18_22940 [Gammaproteobacteria bacterium]